MLLLPTPLARRICAAVLLACRASFRACFASASSAAAAAATATSASSSALMASSLACTAATNFPRIGGLALQCLPLSSRRTSRTVASFIPKRVCDVFKRGGRSKRVLEEAVVVVGGIELVGRLVAQDFAVERMHLCNGHRQVGRLLSRALLDRNLHVHVRLQIARWPPRRSPASLLQRAQPNGRATVLVLVLDLSANPVAGVTLTRGYGAVS